MTALRFFVLLPLLATAAVGHAQNAPTYEPTFSIVISTPQEVVKTGAEVRLKIVFTNNSAQPLHYATGVPGRGTGPGFEIDVRDREGKRIPETPYGVKTQGKGPHHPFVGSVFAATVQPEGTVEREVLSSKEYDLSRPDKYTVQVTERNPNPEPSKSNTMTLTVTP
jgi:hypothetical protein